MNEMILESMMQKLLLYTLCWDTKHHITDDTMAELVPFEWLILSHNTRVPRAG